MFLERIILRLTYIATLQKAQSYSLISSLGKVKLKSCCLKHGFLIFAYWVQNHTMTGFGILWWEDKGFVILQKPNGENFLKSTRHIFLYNLIAFCSDMCTF